MRDAALRCRAGSASARSEAATDGATDAATGAAADTRERGRSSDCDWERSSDGDRCGEPEQTELWRERGRDRDGVPENPANTPLVTVTLVVTIACGAGVSSAGESPRAGGCAGCGRAADAR
jgi:hypothetical protein